MSDKTSQSCQKPVTEIIRPNVSSLQRLCRVVKGARAHTELSVAAWKLACIRAVDIVTYVLTNAVALPGGNGRFAV